MINILLPNLVTGFRLVTGPLYLTFGTAPASLTHWLWVAGAAGSDLLDGRLARAIGGTSSFGAVLDTASDKTLVLCILFKLSRSGVVPGWMFWLILVQYVVLAAEGSAYVHRFSKVPTPDWAAHLGATVACAGILVGLLPVSIWLPQSFAWLIIVANCVHVVTALGRITAPTAA